MEKEESKVESMVSEAVVPESAVPLLNARRVFRKSKRIVNFAVW